MAATNLATSGRLRVSRTKVYRRVRFLHRCGPSLMIRFLPGIAALL